MTQGKDLRLAEKIRVATVTNQQEKYGSTALSFQAHARTECCPREGHILPRLRNLLFVIFYHLTVCKLCCCKRCPHIRVLHISRKPGGHLKNVGARRVTRSEFCTRNIRLYLAKFSRPVLCNVALTLR
jgi:hypothetical protein